MLEELIGRTVSKDSGCVFEVGKDEATAQLLKLQLARRLTDEEIDGCTLPSRIFGPLKEVEFEREGDSFLCTPADSIGETVRLPVCEISFCHFEYSPAFKRLAELNGLQPRCEYMFGGKAIYYIGDLDLSIGRIGWFFLSEEDPSSLQALSTLSPSYSKILITGIDENMSALCRKKGFVFLPLPSFKDGWRLNPTSFIGKIDGISAQELSALTQVPLLLDIQNRVVFFYGVQSARSSDYDFKYLHALATAGKNGMGLQPLFSALEKDGLASEIVHDVRRRLKEAVLKTFTDKSKVEECLKAFDLPLSKNEIKKKGTLFRLNLTPEQIILY